MHNDFRKGVTYMYRYHPFYPPSQRPCSQGFYQPQYFQPYNRNYPPVNTSIFMSSAQKTLTLMSDAQTLLDHIGNSNDFAYKLMNAAQQSNMDEVNKLIGSTGVKVKPIVNINPDGLRLVFDEKLGELDCCHVIVIVRWRES
jgi:hypothetical protein